MMIATFRAPPVRSGPSVAGAAAFDIIQSQEGSPRSLPRGRTGSRDTSNGEDFLFLRRKQLIDLGNHPVGRLLHVTGEAFLIVLGNLVILLELLDGIQSVAANMADRDLGGFGVFMRDFDEFLAAFL